MLGQARYRMLETIREYAAGRLDAAGETGELRRRLTRLLAARVRAEHERRHGAGAGALVGPGRRVPPLRRRGRQRARGAALVPGPRRRRDRPAASAPRSGRAGSSAASFAEGAEWLDAFLAAAGREVPAAVRGAALVGRAQLALAAGDPPGARDLALARAWSCAWRPATEFWIAAALNLLAETALHAGQSPTGRKLADEALDRARQAGDQWNEGYALGTKAAAAALAGNLREAEELGRGSPGVMRAHRPAVGRRAHPARPGRPGPDAARPARRPPPLPGRPCPSCARSTPAPRSPAAWPASAGSRWSRATWPGPASTWPRACG